MARSSRDPYEVLGVSRDASDGELHSSYRRLVQIHHPDHNGGSVEAARRFEEIQDAYAQITRMRKATPDPTRARTRAGQSPRARQAPPPPTPDPEVESRMADLERQVREAHLARERARRAAAEAAARTERRPSDEELGYFKTDDSFSKLLDDARAELSGRFAQARHHPATRRVTDLIDELAAKLSGESAPRSHE
jgi:type IV secretory pathway VirB10-like protein